MARSKRNSGPPVKLLAVVVVMMALAIVFARMAAKNVNKEVEEQPEAKAEDIFGDLPDETPDITQMAPKKPVNTSPEDIASTELWVQAQEIAARAKVVFGEAKEAKAKDDHSVWMEKGKQAKELYNEAITLSVDWEGGLTEKYGDRDVRVRLITAELNRWFKNLEVLAKTTGR